MDGSKNEKINKVGTDLIGLFEGVFKELNDDNAVKAIVLSSKKKDFIAGADIEMFQKVKKKGDFEPFTRKGHKILNDLSNSKKPVVAAIHGNCLGAGLEIALACQARIASDDKSTKMALPSKIGSFAWWWRHTTFTTFGWFAGCTRYDAYWEKYFSFSSKKNGIG
ncbi:MAG: enoyl-CoA hydratase/isomerase family protein [Bacteroidetes bacterium]|nr:enoyl-CoA hydratase/isomerase family protein [Bacteroidota bacterium]